MNAFIIALASATGGKNVRPPCQNPNTTPHLPGPRRGRRPRRRLVIAWFLLALLVYNPSERERRSDERGARSPASSLTEEGAEGPRRLGRNKRPLGKKFSTKVENWPALLYTITQKSKLGYPENHFPDQLETWNFAVFVFSMYLGGPESFKSLRVKVCP